MIFINCDWVDTRWQWSVHLYTNKMKENNYIHKETDTQNYIKTQSTQNRRQDIQNKKTNIRLTIKDKPKNIKHKHKTVIKV
jgi:tRNA G46 methylase TrmB